MKSAAHKRDSTHQKAITTQLETFRRSLNQALALAPYSRDVAAEEESKTVTVPVQVLLALLRECPRCGLMGPVGATFGIRAMGDGTTRPQAWCRHCRAHPDEPVTFRRRKSQ